MERYGILLNEDYKMQVKNGHIALGDTSAQNQAVILIVNPGEIKAHPDLGVGVDSIVNDEDTYIWKYEIRRQLAKDGINISGCKIDTQNGLIKIEI